MAASGSVFAWLVNFSYILFSGLQDNAGKEKARQIALTAVYRVFFIFDELYTPK